MTFPNAESDSHVCRDVLCTDKTGTLTVDKIMLVRHVNVEGEDCEECLKFGYANAFFQVVKPTSQTQPPHYSL